MLQYCTRRKVEHGRRGLAKFATYVGDALHWSAAYVILSHVISIDGLLLLSPPPRGMFSTGAPAPILEEFAQLHALEVAAQERRRTYSEQCSILAYMSPYAQEH